LSILKKSDEINLDIALDNILDFEKLKLCFECGICTASCPVAELVPEYYNPRVLLHNLSIGDKKILKSPELWLCAWCYRCYRRCPQNLNLPEIFQTVRRLAVETGYLEGFYKALSILEEKIPLLASTCHVCFHPERVIKNKQIVKNAIQYASLTDEFVKKKKRYFATANQNEVAIIGSGPAGLSAAKDLAIKGYLVTVFEASASPGGMLRRCIPEYRLPRKSINFDIDMLKDYGIEFKTNMVIGKNLDFKKLVREFDAVFIATGSHHECILKIQGDNLGGIVYALDFLEKANSKTAKVTDKIAIIGGGNVAIDSAITALRLGAKDVIILYRRSEDDMPAGLWEIKEAKEAGIKIEFLVAPNRILGKKGKVTGIECVRMDLGEIDDTGRKRPIPIKDSEFVIEAETIIIAIGQSPSTVFLPKTVEISEKSTISVDPLSLKTSSCGIFAGGDAISGSASIMEAIAAGKQAAKSIDSYLRNKPEKSNKNSEEVRVWNT